MVEVREIRGCVHVRQVPTNVEAKDSRKGQGVPVVPISRAADNEGVQVAREFWDQVGRKTGLWTSFQTLEELWAIVFAFLSATFFSNVKTATAISYIYVFGSGLLGLFLFKRFIQDVTFPNQVASYGSGIRKHPLWFLRNRCMKSERSLQRPGYDAIVNSEKSDVSQEMTGLTTLTSGTTYVQGLDISNDMDEVYTSMGVCPQHE
ncbi:ABC transporter A family member 7 [Acorus calamus]|uniref:ABC transporter A family member 7 n=1 Tax=Acorus calamus TaxID=4465 RepID=A0AAV9DFR2_ACOCL|nr:ABC transporter A family member 7 [Acorus calamus]